MSAPASRKLGARPLPARRRKPVFALTPQQVVERCRARKRHPMCAGEVLALMELMEAQDCNALRLHQRSKVSYAMIADILRLEAFPTTHTRANLAAALGQKLPEFELLAFFCLGEQE